jgi:Flp pilus assembly protein TadG
MLGRFKSMLGDRCGAAVIEFALVSTVMIAILLPLIDVGMGFWYKDQVITAAEAGAHYAFVYGWDGSTSSLITTRVTAATGLSSISATPAPTRKCGCWTGTTGNPYSVTLYTLSPANTGPCSSSAAPNQCPSPNSAAPKYYITSSATVTYTPILNYGGFGNSITLTASSTTLLP